jgi:hypothetical protein
MTMKTAPAVKRLHRAAYAIHGTTGEFRRTAILNFCSAALALLGG